MELESLGTDNAELEWETEVNPDRDYSKGWFYEKDGEIHFTMGQEGKFIYYELSQTVQQNFQKWLNEYVNKK